MSKAKVTITYDASDGSYEVERDAEINLMGNEVRWRTAKEYMKEELMKHVSDYESLYFFTLPLKPKQGTKEEWGWGGRTRRYTKSISKRETKKLHDLYDYLFKTSDIRIYAELKFEDGSSQDYAMFVKLKEKEDEE